MEHKIRLFTNRLIDSVWTIVAIVNETESTVTILEYTRDIELGYSYENYLEKAHLIESVEGRIAEELHTTNPYDKWDTKVIKKYKVTNPKNIFDYSR